MGMQLIETISVGSGGAASMEFTGIAQDGVDLALLLSTRQDAFGHNQVKIRFNSDSGNNYSYLYLTGNGSSVVSFGAASNDFARIHRSSPGPSQTANTFGSTNVLIANYTSSSGKSISAETVSEDNAATAYQSITTNVWTGTAAITTITLTGDAANYVEYTTASLYKITAD